MQNFEFKQLSSRQMILSGCRYFLKLSELASLSNCKNRRECPNRSINNGDMVNKAKRDVVSESVAYI